MPDVDPWEARKMVTDLSKAGRHDEAVKEGEHAVGQHPQHEPVRSALAWAYYRRDVAGLTDKSDLDARRAARRAVDRIRELTTDDPFGQYSALPQAVLKLAHCMAERWPKAAADLYMQLDPSHLSTSSDAKYPSAQARYYLGMTKCFEASRNWSGLLTLCEEALASSGLRPTDRPWLVHRKAKALEHLSDPEGALQSLTELKSVKAEWWIEADLARVLHSLHRNDEAIDAAKRAMRAKGDMPFKWRTAMLIGQLLHDRSLPLSSEHVALARWLRQEGGWPAEPELEAVAELIGAQDGRPNLKTLRQFWGEAQEPDERTGVVKSHLSGGGSGFITPDDGAGDIYFAVPKGSSARLPAVGTRVSYRVVDSFDRKKNVATKRATDVRQVR